MDDVAFICHLRWGIFLFFKIRRIIMALGGKNSGVPTLTPEDVSKISKALGEINDSMTRVAAERDLIKETVAKVSTELGLNKKLIRRMAKTHYNRSFDMDVAEDKDFESLYETVTKRK
jgi:ABC-type microcin C transport system permease subunit YejB